MIHFKPHVFSEAMTRCFRNVLYLKRSLTVAVFFSSACALLRSWRKFGGGCKPFVVAT